MPNTIQTAKRDNKYVPQWWMLLSAMAIIAAANAAFMFTLIGTLSWQEGAVLIFAAAVLTGGALFSAWTMQGLHK